MKRMYRLIWGGFLLMGFIDAAMVFVLAAELVLYHKDNSRVFDWFILWFFMGCVILTAILFVLGTFTESGGIGKKRRV